MENISVDISKVFGFVPKTTIEGLQNRVMEKNAVLENKTGKGNDFLGWVKLPSSVSDKELKEVKATADQLAGKTDVIVVIGIGGSYLGTRAVSEALSHFFNHLKRKRKYPVTLYDG